MKLQDLSYALRAVSDVAHAGEELVGSLSRSRSYARLGPVLLGVGLGLGLGALLFSDSARAQVRSWLSGGPVAANASAGAAHGSSVVPTAGVRGGAASAPH